MLGDVDDDIGDRHKVCTVDDVSNVDVDSFQLQGENGGWDGAASAVQICSTTVACQNASMAHTHILHPAVAGSVDAQGIVPLDAVQVRWVYVCVEENRDELVGREPRGAERHALSPPGSMLSPHLN